MGGLWGWKRESSVVKLVWRSSSCGLGCFIVTFCLRGEEWGDFSEVIEYHSLWDFG